jgi:NAD+ synthase (glutamine-hydrolysing)
VFIVRIALAQINPTVGDLAGNEQKIRDQIARAREVHAGIVVFPELAVPDYPPEDLLLKPSFVEANLACLQRIAGLARDITAIVGYVDRADDLYNAAAVLHEGRVAAVCHKGYLPNYAVFDEDRYVRAGERPLVVSLGEVTVGINICEDIWYPAGPTKLQALAGAQLVINISASPYHAGKGPARERMLALITRRGADLIGMDACSICLLDDDGERLMLEATSGLCRAPVAPEPSIGSK